MYLSENHLVKEYDISLATVKRIIRYIQIGIEAGRYAPDSILYIGGRPRVNNDSFIMAIREREKGRTER